MTDEFKIGSSPPKITKKIRQEISCPNENCNYVFDVANIDWGLMMECPSCKNRTYNPAYDKNKYTSKQVIQTFVIGVLAGLLANYIYLFVRYINLIFN